MAKLLRQWQFGLLIVSFFAAFVPVLSELVNLWSNEADYSHGFLVIPVVLYLIWQKKGKLNHVFKKSSNWGILAVLLALFWFFLGEVSGFRILEYISFIFVIWSSVFYLFGFDVLKNVLWELGFLFFMIPIPSSIYARITLPLQIITTKLTVHLLFLLQIPVYREGNVIHLMDSTLEVVNACSGLRSLLTILALAYIIGIISLKKMSLRFILLLAGVVIAITVNIIRVSCIAVFSHYGYGELSTGTPHMLLGLFLFSFSFLSLIGVKKVLSWIFQKK